MTRFLAALAIGFTALSAPRSSIAQERGAAALGHLVAGLGVSARVLVIGAHPDDEDTQLLAWLVHRQHVDAAYLSLTRGDGGQNLIGNELGEALGVIRTEELLAARRIDGARQYFTRAYDFGFSKTAEETYQHWPKDSILRDAITVVRAFRPHVIVAVFSGTSRDGHGHHQVSGLLAREAYDAAGDSARFPAAATAGLRPWSPLKFYRGYVGRDGGTFAFNVGEYDPLLGRSYAEMAAESRSQHRSQGFGRIQRKGVVMDYLRREATRVPAPEDPKTERSLFDGIDTTWSRGRRPLTARDRRASELLAKLDSVPLLAAAAQRSLDLRQPAAVVPDLIVLHRILDELDGGSRAFLTSMPARYAESFDPDLGESVRRGLERVSRALLVAAGVSVEAFVDRPSVALGDTARVDVTVYARGGVPVSAGGFFIDGTDVEDSAPPTGRVDVVPSDSGWRVSRSFRGTATGGPWWLEQPRSGDIFGVPATSGSTTTGPDGRTSPLTRMTLRMGDPTLPLFQSEEQRLGAAEARGQIGFESTRGDRQQRTVVSVRAPVVNRRADPVRGDVQRPVAIAPVIAVTLDRAVAYAAANTPIDREIRVGLRSAATSAARVRVSLDLPPGLTADTVARVVDLSSYGATHTVSFRLRGRLAPGRYRIGALAESDGRRFTSGYVPIEYEHIRPELIVRDAAIDLRAVDITLPRNPTVAYIRGVGDNVAPMLEQLGLRVTMVGSADVARTDFSRFGSVVVGPRAYEANPELVHQNARLLDYAQRGGTLVVQYGQYEMTRPGVLPYPITLARPAKRVTIEDAPVTIIDRNHPVLTTPNRIGPRDFEGWVQERSIYMPETFAKEYSPLFATSDPGEPESRSAVLVAPVGKGTLIYTTLAFFRQLPAGVPGAARLFVNLLAARSPGLVP